MLLFTFPPQTPFSTTTRSNNYNNTLPVTANYNKPAHSQPHTPCRAAPLSLTTATSSSSCTSPSSTSLRHVSSTCDDESMVSSAAAVAAAITNASTSPVEFVQRIEKGGNPRALVLPSQEFQRLCVEQLDLFRRIVHPDALLSVYVRPAGSYVMDQLELRRATSYPGVRAPDIVVLVGNFTMPAGLRVAESAISSIQAELLPELNAVVFPLVTHPFVVGFLVAELPMTALQRELHGGMEEHYSFTRKSLAWPKGKHPQPQPLDVPSAENNSVEKLKFSTEQKLNSVNIARSLAVAYVMDQKAMLLQQSSWQNNVRMSNLVEQIRGSLSSIKTLSKMLSVNMKKSEISYDIVQDILVQGDHMRDTLQQLQDAVHLTKANIMRYNNENMRKMHPSTEAQIDPMNSHLSNSHSMETSTSKMTESNGDLSVSSVSKDLEFPLPPLALAPSQRGIRSPCTVSDTLEDLVEAIKPLAHKQRRSVEMYDLSRSLQVAVEEPALRQALSNLIEGALLRSESGGRIEILLTEAPAGGALVIIDDDGPDMHYMTQMHSLAPFGANLCAENRIEDNMTWNFVAGLTVAREILENYGCIVRVFSPRKSDAAYGAGGTRVELWLPLSSDATGFVQEA